MGVRVRKKVMLGPGNDEEQKERRLHRPFFDLFRCLKERNEESGFAHVPAGLES